MIPIDKLRQHVKASPIGWHGGQLIRHRSTTDGDVIAWFQELARLVGVEEAKAAEATSCCDLPKTRGPNTNGQMVCPVHCSKCGHDRTREDYLDFCSACRPGDPCRPRRP
jgi:hypothetical protein